ncbi:aspartyl/asparaginyl beta-hydroxylase domain-containing protein [bacterium]|nr:aspartyl/asparaginyl beta-hydroxylase domain-containing protein [bacterium]
MYQYADLTDRFPMTFDLARMRAELEILEGKEWLDHYDAALADGWTTIPLVTHDGSANSVDSQRIGRFGEYKRTKYVDELPYFREILDAFQCPHGRIRIMKLMPGTIIRAHRDTFDEVSDIAFGQVRLHIPIITNDRVIFTVGGKQYHLGEGRLHYVNFTKVHYVRNDGDQPRVHLVLDLKVNDFLRAAFPPATPWQKFEMLAQRTLLPIVLWAPMRTRTALNNAFWRVYEGSWLQSMRHRLFPKT